MAQEQLEGIANASYGTVQTLSWDTATDWDNAADQKSVVHDSYGDLPGDGVIELGMPAGYAASGNTAPLRHYHLHESSQGYYDLVNARTGMPSSNVTGMTHDQDGVGTGTGLASDGSDDEANGDQNLGISGDSVYCVMMVVKVSSNDLNNSSYDHYYGGAGGSNFDSFTISVNNDSTAKWFFNGYSNDATMDTADSNYHTHVVYYDPAGPSVYWYIDGTQQSASPASLSSMNFTDAPERLCRRADGHEWGQADLLQHLLIYDRIPTSTEIAYFSGIISDGYLETATKSFSSSQTPDLQNLSYSLNSQTIDLDVIGSPGTASEEVVTQTLDGATSYTLTWSNSHQDFRLRPNFSTTDPVTSPTFSGGELIA